MGLMTFMRMFTIRLRMVGAIAVVLALLLAVGVAGLWGMARMQAFNQEFVEHAFAESVLLGKLQHGLGDLRRYERDMIIHYESPEQVRAAQARWTAAWQETQTHLAALQQGTVDADNALVDEIRQQLEVYVRAVEPVARQLQAQAYDTATTANMFLRDAHAAFERVDAATAQLDQALSTEAQLAYGRLDGLSNMVLWIFAAALGVAALIVVPTTLANMRSICRPLEQAQGLAVAIARGDLTTEPDLSGSDELAELMRCLADMQASLSRTVGSVREAADSIRQASREIASGNQDLSNRTEQTAGNLQQTASRMEQITQAVRQSSDAAQSASHMARNNAQVAQRGGQVVGQVVSTMQDIDQSSRKISDIIGTIDGIAFQTNILALNAAVEAARAGEAGRGFAVVAGEVRSLAQRSAEAAREIKALIGASVERVAAGTQQVQQAGATIRDIVDNADKVSALIADITTASTEQAHGLAEVNGAVGQLDQVTQQNAALVEQSAAAAESLREQAQRLAELVAVFRLMQGGTAGAGHPPLLPSATRGHAQLEHYEGPERRLGARA